MATKSDVQDIMGLSREEMPRQSPTTPKIRANAGTATHKRPSTPSLLIYYSQCYDAQAISYHKC